MRCCSAGLAIGMGWFVSGVGGFTLRPYRRLLTRMVRSSLGSNSGMVGRRQLRLQRRFAFSSGSLGPQTLNWDEPWQAEPDTFVSALSKNGQVGVKVVSAKQMLQGMMDKREMGEVATEVLGRVMLCAMLVAHGIKDQETLQLTFNGDGLAKGVMAISDGACNVRGWIGNADLDHLKPQGIEYPNMKAAIGRGTVQVVKAHPDWLVPYNGIVEIANGEIAPDVAFYLASSEQRNSAIGVGAVVNGGEVRSASGFYVEMLPGVEEESISQVEANLAKLNAKYMTLDPGRLLLNGLTPYKLAEALLEGLGVGVAEETQPTYRCSCTEEKVFRAIKLLSDDDVKDILSKNADKVEVKCEFCGSAYVYPKAEVLLIRSKVNPGR